MLVVGGMTLVARVGEVLAHLDFVDLKVISTDSDRYAQEGEAHGLAPLLRPAELSQDDTPAIDVLRHALHEAEKGDAGRFDVVLLLEPTSPARTTEDVRAAVDLLLASGADSAVTVSPVDTKFHPDKLLEVNDGKLFFHTAAGAHIHARQQLGDAFYFRNGCCYALTRDCILDRQAVITDNTVAHVVEHPVVNIDTPDDVRVAECLLSSSS